MAQQEQYTQDPVMSQVNRAGADSLANAVAARRDNTSPTLDHEMNRAHVAGFRGDGEHNVVIGTVYQGTSPQAKPPTPTES